MTSQALLKNEVEGDFPLLFALLSTLCIVIFNFTVTNMAAVYIVSDLGGGHHMTTFTISFFAIGNAIGIPLGKELGERIGPAKGIHYCLVFFTLFSLLAAFATGYIFFNATRLLQGIASGPLYALINSVIGKSAPKDKKHLLTTITIMIFTITPAIGASIGGVIAYLAIWRFIFVMMTPINLLIGFYLYKRLKPFHLHISHPPFDWLGFISFAVAVFSIGFICTTGQFLDWYRSHIIRTLFVMGVFSSIFFILHEKNHFNPLFDLSLLKNRIFIYSLINLSVLFASYFGMVILLALWLTLYANYTPVWIGLVIGIMAVAGVIPSFLMNRFGKSDARIPLLIAIILIAASSFYTTFFNVEINLGRVAISRVMAGLGLAFFLTPLFRLAFHSFPEGKTLNVLSLFQVIRALSSGLGTAFYTIIWERRQVFYAERLGEDLTALSPITKGFFNKMQSLHIPDLLAKQELYKALDRQSTALALEDTFYLMGWIVTILIFLMIPTLFIDKSRFNPR